METSAADSSNIDSAFKTLILCKKNILIYFSYLWETR